jgi:hypothetical protein
MLNRQGAFRSATAAITNSAAQITGETVCRQRNFVQIVDGRYITRSFGSIAASKTFLLSLSIAFA